MQPGAVVADRPVPFVEIDVSQGRLEDSRLPFLPVYRPALRPVQLEIELLGDLGGAEIAEPLKVPVDLHGDGSEKEVGRGLRVRHATILKPATTGFVAAFNHGDLDATDLTGYDVGVERMKGGTRMSLVTALKSLCGKWWASSGDDIHNLNAGNVGIGTMPTARLHVRRLR